MIKILKYVFACLMLAIPAIATAAAPAAVADGFLALFTASVNSFQSVMVEKGIQLLFGLLLLQIMWNGANHLLKPADENTVITILIKPLLPALFLGHD